MSLGGYQVADARTLAFLMEKAEPNQVLRMGVQRQGRQGTLRGNVYVPIPPLR